MSLQEQPAIQQEYRNPVVLQRADPWVYKHSDGYYYFTASVPEFDRIELRRSLTIQGLAEAETVICWRKYDIGPMSKNIWAPEIHYIDDKWYIYFAAARADETSDGMFDHRMFVLENASANPLEGEWIEKGQLIVDWESFSLDATTFEHRGVRYLVWAQKDPAIYGNSNLYMAPLASPWTIEGPQVCLTRPDYEWEKIGYLVNEGAAVIIRNGRVFISYSASATDHHYCMGLLWADENSDLMDPANWHKSPVPVFGTDEESGQYGPGRE